jgi:hypothetical protein
MYKIVLFSYNAQAALFPRKFASHFRYFTFVFHLMLDPDQNPVPDPEPECIAVPVPLRKKVAVPVPQHLQSLQFLFIIMQNL